MLIADEIDCMMMLGKPTVRIFFIVSPFGRNLRNESFSSGFFVWLRMKPRIMPNI